MQARIALVASCVLSAVVAQGTPRPAVVYYGAGCPGTGGITPVIQASVNNPFSSTTYSIDLRVQSAPPGSAMVTGMGMGFHPANTPAMGCVVLNSFDAVASGVLGVDGSYVVNIPVPNSVLFTGVNLFGQCVVFDPGASQGVSATAGAFVHQAPWDPAQTQRVRPSLSGVVISELVSLPNFTVGMVGGQFIELYNRNFRATSEALDLSGYVLESQNGSNYTIPSGTTLEGEAFLVIDLANGDILPHVAPGTATLQTTFDNNFFPTTNSYSALALRNSFGVIVDAVIWGLPSTTGLGAEITSTGEWSGVGIASTFFPGYGDIGFARRNLHAVDVNTRAQWAEGNNVGPTPGTVYNPQASLNTLFGTVRDNLGNPISGASISLIGTSLTATTNASGRFSIASLAPGAYQVHVTKAGYAPVWQVVPYKSALRSEFFYAQMSPEAGNSVTQSIGPAGGTIVDPNGNFEITFPPNFLTTTTSIKATWLPPRFAPDTQCTVAREALFAQSVLRQTIGSVHVEPHLEPPAGSGLTAQVKLKFAAPFQGRAVQGDAVQAEITSDSGSCDAVMGGSLTSVNGTLFAVLGVPHFSTVTGYHEIKSPSGKKYLFMVGERTSDVNGDGTVDILDSTPDCVTLCPGDSSTTSVERSVEVTTAAGGNWEVNGEAGASVESGALTALIAKGEAGVKFGGKFARDHNSSSATSMTFSQSITREYNGSNNDKQEKCVYVYYQALEIWAQGSYCPGHKRPFSKNGDLLPPDLIVLVPVGYDIVTKVIGHCP